MKLPSVTGILRDSGISVMYESQAVLDGAKRGRLVHSIGHLLAMGKTVDTDTTVSDGVVRPLTDAERAFRLLCEPFIAGVQSFLQRHEFRLVDAEKEVCNEVERYVTHPDWLGYLDGEPIDIDLKTGSVPAWTGVQLGGQLHALRSIKYPDSDRMRRAALELPGDGTFKLKYFTDPRDMSEFIILSRAWWIRRKYVDETTSA